MRPLLRIIFLLTFVLATLLSSAQRKKDYTQFVNPFIGTGENGHTYPGAVVPFGMVQLSPDTRLTGGDGGSGYNYSDTVVYGFSHTHLSGSVIADCCDILFMPTTGEPKLKSTEYASGFTKKNESASPGYYKTRLDKYDIGVELTATTRVGVHRYNYPSTSQANIIIDLEHGDTILDSWIEVINDHEIRGFRSSKSWANDRSVYFYAKFSKPFKSYGIALNDQLQQGQSKLRGKNIKMYIQFDNPGEVVAKVGISFVNADGALKNLDAEVPDFDFKKVEKDAKASWNTELSKIEVEGGGPNAAAQQEPVPQNINTGYNTQTGYNRIPKAKKKEPVIDYAKSKLVTFYTALYHTMLAPNIYNDVDGQYSGMDQKIHKAEGFNYYIVFSLRDTYRAKHQLLNLIDRKRTLDFIKSFLAMYEQGGLPPTSPPGSNETYYITSIPAIVDAYAEGIRDFNAEEAFTAMKAGANRNQSGLDSYRKNGVVLYDDEKESVSKTLEYAYNDWCIAQMAKMLNKPQDYTEFIQRAQYWKNCYNNQNGFMQARANGGWVTPFDPTEVTKSYAKANAWQYSFSVPQDTESLIASMGGKAGFEAKLDELFTTDSKTNQGKSGNISGWIGQYAHGNEAGHDIAYLYNFTDAPDKTQLYVNRILREAYSDKPDGLPGSDGCRELSAWYVMSSLGFYNITPGQLQFQVGIPQFEKATINLENGKKFTVLNSGAGVSRANIYLQGLNLNKKSYNKLYLNYTDIAGGGEFEVFTGRLPNRLFVQDLEKPTSKITDNLIVPNPYIIAPSKTFKQSLTIEIKCADVNARIYYTLDGSVPGVNSTLYSSPVSIQTTTTVKAIAVEDGKTSFVDVGTFTKI